MERLRHVIREIHRRSLWQVLGIYLAASWGVLEAIDGIVETAGLPDWLPPFALVLLLIGLPVVLSTAFVQEGMGKRGADGERPGPRGPSASEPPRHIRAARRLFTWRNALIGGTCAFALWGVVAATWVALGGAGSPLAPDEDRGSEDAPGIERSIAVLPFQNLSGDAEAEPFTAGIHDDLLTRLSKIGDLEVISWTSVNRYRDTRKSLPEIARELDVAWIVEGGVQRAGDRVRVNAQLIDPASDQHVWAESYDRRLTVENIFEIQSDLTRRIAAALEAELSPADERRVAAGTTGSLEAYDLHQRGRFALNSRTPGGIRRAIENFTLAVERDSGYALAYSGLADALTLGWFYGFEVGDEPLERGLDTARRAVALDEDLPEAHASVAWALTNLRDAPGAEREYLLALDLDPNLFTAHHWYALLLLVMDRPADALEHLERSLERDPLSPAVHASAALAYVALADGAAAERHLRRAVDLEPGYGLGWLSLGRILAASGSPEDGIGAAERGRGALTERGDSIWGGLASLAVVQALGGRPDSARVLLQRARRAGSEPFWIGLAHAAMGERDPALAWLGRSRWERTVPIRFRYHPILDPLRSDPSFDDLLARMERAWGLREPDGPPF